MPPSPWKSLNIFFEGLKRSLLCTFIFLTNIHNCVILISICNTINVIIYDEIFWKLKSFGSLVSTLHITHISSQEHKNTKTDLIWLMWLNINWISMFNSLFKKIQLNCLNVFNKKINNYWLWWKCLKYDSQNLFIVEI